MNNLLCQLLITCPYLGNFESPQNHIVTDTNQIFAAAAVAVSLVEDGSSSSPPQAPLITQPLSDSDDPHLSLHKSSLKSRHYCQIGNFESDSFNENFSPTRPANARRKRKYKKMPVEYTDGKRSPPIEILSVTTEVSQGILDE